VDGGGTNDESGKRHAGLTIPNARGLTPIVTDDTDRRRVKAKDDHGWTRNNTDMTKTTADTDEDNCGGTRL
jgi:hypothetical protein